VMEAISASDRSKSQVLAELGVPRRSYYNWLKKQRQGRLLDDRAKGRIPWNRLTPEEVNKVIEMARASPEASCRQLAYSLVDDESTSISESTVYRILKREGLVKTVEVTGFSAGKEYQRKTRRPNQMWATDCSYLKVPGWGYYYLITVIDDYSRYILTWDLKCDMTSDSIIGVVQQAVATHNLPRRGSKQLKVLYATQAEVNPPTFVFFVNDAKLIHFSYRRYLENKLRQSFGFAGTPLRLVLKTRGEQ